LQIVVSVRSKDLITVTPICFYQCNTLFTVCHCASTLWAKCSNDVYQQSSGHSWLLMQLLQLLQLLCQLTNSAEMSTRYWLTSGIFH